MYRNLRFIMDRNGVTSRKIAELLGLAEKTISNKMNGYSEWTYPEVMKIKRFLFPEYDLEYLFATDNDNDKKTA